MSVFVVRFIEDDASTFRGVVRQVTTGEETVFSDEHALLGFFQRMRLLSAMERTNAAVVEAHRAALGEEESPPVDPTEEGM